MVITWIIGLEAVLVIFGWLLGLLSVPIASRIEKRYKRNELKAAIFSELKFLMVRLAATHQKIQTHLGTSDKSSLLWLKGIYEKYRIDIPRGILEHMNKVLQVSDEDFKAVIDYFKAPDDRGSWFKNFSNIFYRIRFGGFISF